MRRFTPCNCGTKWLLLHKKTYNEWSDVNDHIWKELKDDSLEIQEILSFSYNDLSPKIKKCFVYLGRFLKDYTFEVNELKLLWIAKDFISEVDEEDGLAIEAVAESYLVELISRNMIQIAELYFDGQISECRIHDLVRDLAIQKAVKDNFLGIFHSNKQHQCTINLLHQQPRHVIYNDVSKYLDIIEPNKDHSKLCSLTVIIEIVYMYIYI